MRSHSGKCFANSQRLSAEGRAALPALQGASGRERRSQHPQQPLWLPALAARARRTLLLSGGLLVPSEPQPRTPPRSVVCAEGHGRGSPTLWPARAPQTRGSSSVGVSTGSLHRSWDSQEPGDEVVKGDQVLGEWPLQKALGQGPGPSPPLTTTPQSAQGQLSPRQVSCPHGNGLTAVSSGAV